MPAHVMAGLRADVIAQIEELSTLVGDLVDLSREDGGVVIHEPDDMADVVPTEPVISPAVVPPRSTRTA